MANGKTKSTFRRREVRRSLGKERFDLMAMLRDRRLVWPILWAAITTVICGLVIVNRDNAPEYEVDQRVTRPIVSRVRFEAVDQDKTRARREDAYQREPAVYVPNLPYFEQVRQRLDALVKLAGDKNIQSLDQVQPEYRETMKLTEAGFAELRKFVTEDGAVDARLPKLVAEFMDALAGIAILTPERAVIESDTKNNRAMRIWIKHPIQAKELERYPTVIVNGGEEPTVDARLQGIVDRFPKPLQPTIMAAAKQNLDRTYDYDEAATMRRRERARDETPDEKRTYAADEVLVAVGKQLAPLDLVVLAEEQRAYEAKAKAEYPWRWFLGSISGLLLLAMIVAGMWGYIAAYKPRICENRMRGLAVTAMIVAGQLLAVVLAAAGQRWVIVGATFPILLMTMVVTICYGRRFALAFGAMHATLVAVTLQLPVATLLVTLTGIVVAVSQLHDVRMRSKLVIVGGTTALAMAAATLIANLAHRPLYLSEGFVDAQWLSIGLESLGAALAALFAGLIVQGALPAIERLFNVTTAMTLRELNDASHPLLRRLAEEATGTYQHSLRLADLAESAAEAIDADGLLCRVSAMYHDIGKMNKPQYFIENQGGGPNRHNKLSPAMSVLIIVGHVKDGIEMAREYRLPQPIRHAIESHHGTTLVEYFYHAAKRQSDAKDLPEPTEFEFRYPGPKPQTKEAAILMLGDAVESAARSLDEPTPGRLEQLVTAMARKRLMDGQYDECNLTLAELHKIELAMHKTMCAIYHGRVKYPGDAKQPPRPRDAEPAVEVESETEGEEPAAAAS